MKGLLIRLAMYTCIALVPIGCGTRKVDMNKGSFQSNDNSNTVIEQSKETSQIINTQDEALNIRNKSNETTETIVNRKFDKDTGKQIESTETTKTGLKKDNSQLYIKTITINNIRTIEKLKTVTITIRETKTNYKTKNTKTSNSQLYWMLFGLGVIAIIVVFGYNWLKSKYKAIINNKI